MSDDTQKYWINQDGHQQGPFTLDQLRQMELDEDAFVWNPELDDWKPVGAVPELARLLQAKRAMPEPAPVPTVYGPPALWERQKQSAFVQDSAQSPAQQPYPACPPTNLVWAILATILCCLPAGVVAIFYATKVSKKYYEGDLAAAEHYSEVGAWWCIGSIVAGIALSPLVSLLQMALMS